MWVQYSGSPEEDWPALGGIGGCTEELAFEIGWKDRETGREILGEDPRSTYEDMTYDTHRFVKSPDKFTANLSLVS